MLYSFRDILQHPESHIPAQIVQGPGALSWLSSSRTLHRPTRNMAVVSPSLCKVLEAWLPGGAIPPNWGVCELLPSSSKICFPK